MKSRWMYALAGNGACLALIAALAHIFTTVLLGFGLMYVYWNLGEYYRAKGE